MTTIVRPEIEDFFDQYGFSVSTENYSDGTGLTLQQYTPAGEDWYVEIGSCKTVGDLLEEIERYYESFDVSEETALWIGSAGKNGVPEAPELVKDQEWKDELLKKMSEDTSRLYLSDFSVYIPIDLSQTLETRPFTVDESSVILPDTTEYGKPYVEGLVEVWTGDGKNDFYGDMFVRAECMTDIENQGEYIPDVSDGVISYAQFKEIEGFEESSMDVYAKVFPDKTAELYCILKDNDGNYLSAKTVHLTSEEQESVYDTFAKALTYDKLTKLFEEAEEVYNELLEDKTAANRTLLNDYAAENFYDQEDIIRTYFEKVASLEEITEFVKDEGETVTLFNVNETINHIIDEEMTEDEISSYAERCLKELYDKNIQGEKGVNSKGKAEYSEEMKKRLKEQTERE